MTGHIEPIRGLKATACAEVLVRARSGNIFENSVRGVLMCERASNTGPRVNARLVCRSRDFACYRSAISFPPEVKLQSSSREVRGQKASHSLCTLRRSPAHRLPLNRNNCVCSSRNRSLRSSAYRFLVAWILMVFPGRDGSRVGISLRAIR